MAKHLIGVIGMYVYACIILPGLYTGDGSPVTEISLLVAPEIVISTTYSWVNDDNFVKMIMLCLSGMLKQIV